MKNLAVMLMLLGLVGVAEARSLEEIRAELEGLQAQEAAAATESDCGDGLVLLGVRAASPGGMYALRPGHPAIAAVDSVRTELAPLEDAAWAATKEVRDVTQEVSSLEAWVSRLETAARERRAEAAGYREKVSDSNDESRRRTLYEWADEADRKAAELEEQARQKAAELQAAIQRMSAATTAQASAEAAARPTRQLFAERVQAAEKLAEKCK